MIGRIFSVPRALRGRTVDEARDRLRQKLTVWRERTPLARAELDIAPRALGRRLRPDLPADPVRLREALRRDACAGLPGLADLRATVALLRARAPEHAADVVRRARAVQAGYFDLLGHERLRFGQPIDWHLDPLTGRRAPRVHWSRVPYLDADVVGDHKVIWELNRQQYLVTLGQAYHFTGDESFASTFVEHVEGWIAANPPKTGINWASSLEVSFRAISWVWALRLFRESQALTPELYSRMVQVLDIHGWHLERYLSTYFSPNTHLTGEALGLVHLGLLLPELRRAERWRAVGQGVLEAWLPRQVRPDGVYFEQATQYHRYTADIYAHLVVLAEAQGVALAQHVRPTLERVLEHLMHLTRGDGTMPLLGDDDGGRLAPVDGQPPHHVRGTLAVGAALFGRPDFAFAAAGELAYVAWLLGPGGVRRLDELRPAPPSERSRAFPDGGFYVMRGSWTADDDHLVLDCGPHGTMNCGHAHADALAVELTVNGRAVLVDSGTYTYPGPERNAFRSSAAHNTVTVDGVSSSVPTTPFQWARTARGSAKRWHAHERFDFFEGTHDGYLALPQPAIHRREVLHLRNNYWVVRDRLESRGDHRIEVRWHCAPELIAEVVAQEATLRTREEPVLMLTSFASGEMLRVEAGSIAPRYGCRRRVAVVVQAQKAAGTHEVVTFLVAPRPGCHAPRVTELASSGGGRIFRVRRDDGEDWLLLGGDGSSGAHDIRSDASWLWLRFDRDDKLGPWLALDVSRLVVDGRTFLAHPDRDEWRVSRETNQAR